MDMLITSVSLFVLAFLAGYGWMAFYIVREQFKIEQQIVESNRKYIDQLQQVLEYAQEKCGEDFSLWNEKFKRKEEEQTF